MLWFSRSIHVSRCPHSGLAEKLQAEAGCPSVASARALHFSSLVVNTHSLAAGPDLASCLVSERGAPLVSFSTACRPVGVEVAVRDGFQMRGLPSPLLWPGQASPRGQRGSLSGSSTASMCARHTGSELPVTSQVSCWAFKCFFFTRRFGGWGTTVYFVGGVWQLKRR